MNYGSILNIDFISNRNGINISSYHCIEPNTKKHNLHHQLL
jgi:hypothetical protein